MASNEADEFNIDEFLESKTAERLEEMLVDVIYRGIIRAFWTILVITVLLNALLFVVGVQVLGS
ncbi:MAG: hypothetical protein AAF547_20900 [Actinomycetota bacterium]